MALKGIVKWYNEMKGYGFIETEGKVDLFVHKTGLHSSTHSLETGDEVEYETQSGEKGLSAVKVKKIKA
jgi:CspA family cold shock protein